jgi:hypothetical protein
VGLRTPYVRTLDNHSTFNDSKPTAIAWQEGREVWGGAFWEIRNHLGAAATDKALAMAWRTMVVVATGDDTASKFIEALLSSAHDRLSPMAAATIANILKDREFPYPCNPIFL